LVSKQTVGWIWTSEYVGVDKQQSENSKQKTATAQYGHWDVRTSSQDALVSIRRSRSNSRNASLCFFVSVLMSHSKNLFPFQKKRKNKQDRLWSGRAKYLIPEPSSVVLGVHQKELFCLSRLVQHTEDQIYEQIESWHKL
jgi:hypothetical protein